MNPKWYNYLLIRAARAKDFPQYMVLHYLVARPIDEPSEAVDVKGFKEIKTKVEIKTLEKQIIGLN